MFELFADPNAWASLLTLTLLEIVLGIDNVIFLSIVSAKLPAPRQPAARRIGLLLALALRIALLVSITWIIGLTEPVLELAGRAFSWRDLVLLAGGLFLLFKATGEIHGYMEAEEEDEASAGAGKASFGLVVLQIVLLDAVFSIDSVLTAVGMSGELAIMIAAVVAAMAVMLWAAEPVSDFVNRHPTVKMLALAFLLLIGVTLVADGLQFHIPRGYLYFAVAFSAAVEAVNLTRRRKRRRPDAAGRG
ncbi:Membrane protein TerC, possibly involved in tellurium resistance [Tistlia consotensis]|uniref:Membrane protein TerC, possibly involved in tellurium resistance n=1 Tax=Tistlia consotensis USBA 355 TaxID=560819 RepID=A0A1Y6BXX8_9PROT|nr:TerC family protein [Tistlia consotensis]SMF33754.1 Membrane protein TerC, possibly involved in tellurium resistance [Tistlia consotensis USBA 355]SNR70305.1 Membrane protein TerC, possibly involved in tellurium resistance [Tistlia consotensis]